MTTVLPAYSGSDSYVFVSYSHKDSAVVYDEIRYLQKLGVNVWYDEGIDAGDEWTETLANAISGCIKFLFFITPNSVASGHCRRELNFANQQAIAVTAIHLESTELPGGIQLSIGNRQAIIKYLLSDADYSKKLTKLLRLNSPDDLSVASCAVPIDTNSDWDDPRRGILVLPFVSKSQEEDADFLSTGIADEIITVLSAIPGLRVISKNSARQFEDNSENRKLLSEQLNVHYILEGRVQKIGKRLRITAQLPSTRSGEILWAEKWDSSVEKIFDIQETIAQGVVDALEIQLSASQNERLKKRPIPNVHAYEYYLRARQLIHRYTPEALQEALKYLLRGQDIMGENTYITTAIGYVHWQFRNLGIDPDSEHMEEAQKCINELFRLNPHSPDAHHLAGLVSIKEKGKIRKSVNHLKVALQADPNDTDTLFWLSILYAFGGRVSSGMALAERLLKLDPLTTLHQVLPGFINMLDGNIDQACPQLLNSHKLNPGNPITTLTYGQCLAMNGNVSEAERILSSLNEFAPGTVFSEVGKFYMYGMAKNKDAALAIATDELKAEASTDQHSSWCMAQCYALIDEHEASIDWLEQAIQYGLWNYPLIAERDTLLAPIRRNERFELLMAELKEKWIYFDI